MGVNAFLKTIFLFNLNSYHAQNLYRGMAYLLKSTVGKAASISLTSKPYCLLEKQFDSKKYHWLRTNLVRKKKKKKEWQVNMLKYSWACGWSKNHYCKKQIR